MAISRQLRFKQSFSQKHSPRSLDFENFRGDPGRIYNVITIGFKGKLHFLVIEVDGRFGKQFAGFLGRFDKFVMFGF